MKPLHAGLLVRKGTDMFITAPGRAWWKHVRGAGPCSKDTTLPSAPETPAWCNGDVHTRWVPAVNILSPRNRSEGNLVNECRNAETDLATS